MKQKMKNYWYEEIESGEEFLVGAYTKEEADEIAKQVLNDIIEEYSDEYSPASEYGLKFYGTISNYEAEISGLDEY